MIAVLIGYALLEFWVSEIKVTNTKDLVEDDPSVDEAAIERHKLTVANLRDLVDPEAPDELAIADLGRALNKLARLHAMRRDYEPAVQAQSEANRLWSDLNRKKALFLGKMNLNRWRFRNGEEISPWAEFLAEIDQDVTLEVYRDFVWEYDGRCASARGEYDYASSCLKTALEIRVERGRADRIIKATAAMIRTVESLAIEHGN